jgi:hypothetical protein
LSEIKWDAFREWEDDQVSTSSTSGLIEEDEREQMFQSIIPDNTIRKFAGH